MLADDRFQSALHRTPGVATGATVRFRSPASLWLQATAVVALIAGLIFAAFPGLDLAVTRHFYAGDNLFVGNGWALVGKARLAFNILFYSVCTLSAAGLVVTAIRASAWLGLTFRKWLFLAVCLLTGPLVVTNIGFKDHWGRARPRDIVEFGGGQAYTPPFPPSNQCDYNCSFVSGEASAIYIVFFAGAVLFPVYRKALVAGGTVLGSVAGLIRMLQGGHFLSDVAFAGIFMAVTAGCVWLLFDFLSSPNGSALGSGIAKGRPTNASNA